MAMSMYYIKTGLEYWKPKGYGYTKSREEAGVFTISANLRVVVLRLI